MMRVPRLTRTVVVALGVLSGGLALSAAPAGALTAFGPFLPPSFGVFNHATGVAVDPSNGNVYVANGPETVDVFGSEGGSPAGGGPSTLTGSFHFGGEPAGVAVDNSGDVYVTGVSNGAVYKYKLNGAHEYELLSELTGFGEPIGVAVDSLGDVYVANYGGKAVEEFTPTGEKIEAFTSPNMEKEHPQGVAVDSGGDVYVQGYNPPHNLVELKRSSPTSKTVLSESEIASEGVTGIAFDRAIGGLLVDFGSRIVQYNSEGGVVASTIGEGKLGESLGLAVNEMVGKLDVSDNASHDVDVFGSLALPAAITEPASGVLGTSATLVGQVKPEGAIGGAVGIEFEYGLSVAYEAKVTAEPEAVAAGEQSVQARVSGLEPNRTYHYRVLAHTTEGTSSPGQDVTFTTSLKPAVKDGVGSVSNVSRSGALLEGMVNPENSATVYHFAYGLTESYGQSTQLISAGAGLAEMTVGPLVLSGLHPGTTYHFALVASNAAGSSTGPDETFTTLPATPPVVSGESSGVVMQTTAQVAGMVNPEGLTTSCEFQLGVQTGDYVTVATISAGSGSSPQSCAQGLTGLAPGTVYHYRIMASNEDGSTPGPDQTFTTLGFPPAFTQPTTPLLIVSPAIAFPMQEGVTTTKTRTNAQRLAVALKACRKDRSMRKRAKCRARVRARYASSVMKG